MQKICITYRRDDTDFETTTIHGKLAERFDPDSVFCDFDGIKPGEDFRQKIEKAFSGADVVLAVIGPRWLTIQNDAGQRRLDSANDFLRLELETALRQKIRLIPILVKGAQIPKPDELPES